MVADRKMTTKKKMVSLKDQETWVNEKLIQSEMVFNGLSDQESSYSKIQGGSAENNSFSFMQKQI